MFGHLFVPLCPQFLYQQSKHQYLYFCTSKETVDASLPLLTHRRCKQTELTFPPSLLHSLLSSYIPSFPLTFLPSLLHSFLPSYIPSFPLPLPLPVDASLPLLTHRRLLVSSVYWRRKSYGEFNSHRVESSINHAFRLTTVNAFTRSASSGKEAPCLCRCR